MELLVAGTLLSLALSGKIKYVEAEVLIKSQ